MLLRFDDVDDDDDDDDELSSVQFSSVEFNY